MKKINYDEVKKELKSKLPDYLSELGINSVEMFNCINPYHDDKNPSMGLYDKGSGMHVHCFGCGAYWDIFDVYAVETKQGTVNSDATVTYDYKKIFSDLATKYNINLPEYKPSQEDQLNQKVSELAQYTIKVAQAHLDETDYLKKRGISMELAKKFHLGYVSTWDNPKTALQGKKITPTPRIIIPTSENTYLARDARLEIPDNEEPYKKQKVGKVHLFNSDALFQDQKPIFLVEGEFDALSIMEASDKVEAVALGSTQDQGILKKTISQAFATKVKAGKTYDPTFFIAMDGDEAGDLANHQIKQILDQANYTSYIVTNSLLTDDSKDANDSLVKDPKGLRANINNILKDPDKYLTNLLQRIQDNRAKQQYIPTGLGNLDEILDGGLYPQLYVIGAVTSLGKTTFNLQIADNVARRGHQVLFFSLETSRDTLSEKNISRLTFDTCNNDISLAQTARSIDNGNFLKEENGQLKYPKLFKHVMKSFEFYNAYYTNLHINNGILHRPTAQEIYNQVAKFCNKHPEAHPLIIVDYLQILKPMEAGLTDKEAVTESVSKLNEITEEFKCPVMLISSFNRQNYDNEVCLQSFKESGEIEYYSDVLLGLQYQKDYKPDYDSHDNTQPRKVELLILKNRNGESRKKAYFDFYCAFNEFLPDQDYIQGKKLEHECKKETKAFNKEQHEAGQRRVKKMIQDSLKHMGKDMNKQKDQKDDDSPFPFTTF